MRNSLGGHNTTSNIRSIQGDGAYKIRFHDGQRIPFLISDQNGQVTLKLGHILSHQEGEKLHTSIYKFTEQCEIWQLEIITTPEAQKPSYTFSPICRLWRDEDRTRLIDNVNAELRLALNTTQTKFLEQDGPIFLKGTAGSGKTTITIYRLAASQANQKIYITYTPYLKKYAESTFASIKGKEFSGQVKFSTVEEICLELVAGTGRFTPENKMTFDLFKKLNFVQECYLQHKINAYILWEEIRGVIKQAETTPTITEYKKQAGDNKVAKAVGSIYQKYLNYLETKQMWDDIDLAKAALKVAQTVDYEGYDEVMVDEAQDLTKVHFKLFCHLVKSSQGLFIAGDQSQSIHPSKFQWQDVEEIINHSLGLKEGKSYRPYHMLQENYRNPQSVFDLAFALKQWQSQVLTETNDLEKVTIYKQGHSPIELINPAHFRNFSIDLVPETAMVIVLSEDDKEEARHIFGKGSVYTVAQAKGLENKHIILYKFFENQDIDCLFKLLINFGNVKAKVRHYSTLLNLLHVAITRSEHSLYLVSKKSTVQKCVPLANFPFNLSDGTELKEILLTHEQDGDKYFKYAQKLEANGQIEQATEYYFKAGNLGCNVGHAHGYKCQGILAKQAKDYQKAITYFENALDTENEQIIKEIDECKGLLFLKDDNLVDAKNAFLSADISPITIVERFCSTKSNQRYNESLKVILAKAPSYLGTFLKQNNMIYNLSLTLDEAWKVATVANLIDTYFQAHFKLKKEKLTKCSRFYEKLQKRLEELLSKEKEEGSRYNFLVELIDEVTGYLGIIRELYSQKINIKNHQAIGIAQHELETMEAMYQIHPQIVNTVLEKVINCKWSTIKRAAIFKDYATDRQIARIVKQTPLKYDDYKQVILALKREKLLNESNVEILLSRRPETQIVQDMLNNLETIPSSIKEILEGYVFML